MNNICYFLNHLKDYFEPKGYTNLQSFEELFDKQFFFPKDYRKKSFVIQKVLTEEKFDFYLLVYHPSVKELKLLFDDFNKFYVDDKYLTRQMTSYNINPSISEDIEVKVISIKLKPTMWNEHTSCEDLFRREHAAQWYELQSEDNTNKDETKYHIGRALLYLGLIKDVHGNIPIIMPDLAYEHYSKIRKLLKKPAPTKGNLLVPNFDLITINDIISNQLYHIECGLTEQFRRACEQGSLDYDKDKLLEKYSN